ncbi:MAG: C69 family dipeptidase [Bacteroidales bacterium]|nr:C69 family dipeptidase [Bacteroidales bacterium]
MKKHLLILILGILFSIGNTNACTNFLITPGASADGSSIITYAADSHILYGELYFIPRADWATGAMLPIYEWDTGKFLGKIPQIAHTYQVVGNMNENQVSIGETTYGGLSELESQNGAIIDYGSLIYIALQRAETARDAIRIMAELMDEYGYASSGESFSVADPNEVWIFEVIGRGNYSTKGAVWVALKIPDGYVCGHANQARITTFEYQSENKWNDPNAEVFNSKDVISFAKDNGFFDGRDNDFSFSDVYAPVDFGGARFCEIRVWSMFKDVNEDFKNNQDYFNYAKGFIEHNNLYLNGNKNPNNFASNRMPLWIKPDKKISLHDVMNFMRDHLEGTELDMTQDFGAGPYGCPYRWRPLTWEVDGVTYFNERATGTQQTGFSFVAQSRKWLPNPIGGKFWFSVDDAASTVYTPLYCGIKYAPVTYAEGNGSMFSWGNNSAFWTFNQVSNLAYTRYDSIHPEIHQLQQAIEDGYIAYAKGIDDAANALYQQDKDMGIQFITDYSVTTANSLVDTWNKFYQYLFMKYHDGNIMKTRNMQIMDNGNNNGVPAFPNQPEYGDDWYKKIIEDTGDKLKYQGSTDH